MQECVTISLTKQEAEFLDWLLRNEVQRIYCRGTTDEFGDRWYNEVYALRCDICNSIRDKLVDTKRNKLRR